MARSSSTLVALITGGLVATLHPVGGALRGEPPAPGVEWEADLEDRSPSADVSIQPLDGGGHVFIADRQAGPYLVELDPQGQVVWEEAVEALGPSGGSDDAAALALSSDGGYLLARRRGVQDTVSGYHLDAHVVKLDAGRRLEWQTTHGTRRDDVVAGIHATRDGGYAVAGGTHTSDDPARGYDIYLMRLNPEGGFLWQKNFGPRSSNSFTRAVEWTADDGCIVAALSYAWEGGPSIYLFRADGDGNLVWEKTLSSSGAVPALRQEPDGTIILVDYWVPTGGAVGTPGLRLLKVRADGETDWVKSPAEGFFRPASVEVTSDGYLITGYTVLRDELGWDAHVVRTTRDGDLLWQKSLGGVDNEEAIYGRETPDGGSLIWRRMWKIDGSVSERTTRLFKLGSPGEPRFRRGDANADGKVDIGDPIAALAYLFLGGLVPGCLDAVDANDDGVLNITDPVFTLGYLFLGESEIPPPGARVCGPDPSAEGLPHCVYEPAGC